MKALAFYALVLALFGGGACRQQSSRGAAKVLPVSGVKLDIVKRTFEETESPQILKSLLERCGIRTEGMRIDSGGTEGGRSWARLDAGVEGGKLIYVECKQDGGEGWPDSLIDVIAISEKVETDELFESKNGVEKGFRYTDIWGPKFLKAKR
jgi:hypothetical protein